MPYVRAYGRRGPNRLTMGCAGCGGACASCRAGLGDDLTPAQTISLVRTLQAQINRFVPLIYATKTPVNGVLDVNTAGRALGVMVNRAITADIAIPNDDTQKLLTEAAGAVGAPIPFVTTNLPLVAQTVKLYGDMKGLPAAMPDLAFLSDPRVLAGAAVIGGIFVFMRLRGRKR